MLGAGRGSTAEGAMNADAAAAYVNQMAKEKRYVRVVY